MPLMFGTPLREMTGRIRRLRSVVALVAEQGFGTSARTAGAAGGGRDAVDQGEGLGTPLTFAAVVMTLSGVPRPS